MAAGSSLPGVAEASHACGALRHGQCARSVHAGRQRTMADAKTCSDCNSTSNADCYPKQDYVLCSCKSGFVGNGVNCTKLVFCDRTCCPPGYTWDTTKKTCVDINECQTTSAYTCLTQSQCLNKNGAYICSAPTNPLCPTETCAAGQDCVRSGSGPDVECIDPCNNHKVIDGSQRLYTINSVGRFPTDRYLFGWHRYDNNLRLREGPVGALKCGSVQPYSLNSHPTVSEGVKSVPLIKNELTKNSTGPSILVKACPAGYYVYKFSGLLTFEVYCTDLPPTTTSTTTTTTTTTTPTTATTTTPTITTTTPTTITTPEPTTTTTTPPTSTTPEPTNTTTTPPTSTTPESTTTTTTPPTSTTPESTTTTTTPPTSTNPESTTTTTTPPTSTTPEPTTTTTTTAPPTTETTLPTSSTTKETTAKPVSTNATTALTTAPPTKTTPCKNTTTPAPVIPTTPHIVEENITVTAVQSKSTLSVRILTQTINNKEVKSMEINETTVVNIDMRTISSSHIYIKKTKSISPTSILILIGSDGPQTFSNATDTVVTTTESTIPNTSSPTAYCSKPAETSTVTETGTIAGDTCSKVTSASTTTTITSTEEVIVLGPDGFTKSCTYF